jgi:drug/metabolite transporter (DMT)-like permease
MEKTMCFGLIKKANNKTLLNLCFCHLNIGLIFVYIYILGSSFSSIISRILFHNYKFLFNFTLFFSEQLICAIIFTIFKGNIQIDLNIFWKNKYFYIGFSIVYILNVLSVFYGHQLVYNVSMYFTLKKLTPLMLFFHDFFFGKKKISITTIVSIFLIVGGSLLVAKDSFTKDYLGSIIVLMSNILTIIYCKLTEIYHNVSGYTNIQLLIYNNYLTLPILFFGIFLTGEHNRLYNYFTDEDNGSEGNFYHLFLYIFLYGIACSIQTSSFFISNEKNSSLLTKLLSCSRAIFVTVFLHIFDKKKNKLNVTILLGLILSIIGSILINVESIFKNIHTEESIIKDKVKVHTINNNEETVEIVDMINKNKI